MEDQINLKFDKAFVRLGAYQFIGGIIGLAILFYPMYVNGLRVVPVFFLLIVFFLFYLYSIICSILCLKRHELALSLSYINQLIQLVSFGIGGYFYKYIAGVYLSLCFDLTSTFNFSFGFGISNMEIRFNTESNALSLEINLISIAIMIWIDMLRIKMKSEGLKTMTEEIGIG